MASKRAAMRSCKASRSPGTSANALSENGSAARAMPWSVESALPVSRHTSSARWMRCVSPGAIRCAICRIDARELRVQRRPAALGRFGVDICPHRGIRLRQHVEPPGKGAVVEHGAAHQISGSFPAARMLVIAAIASLRQRPVE